MSLPFIHYSYSTHWLKQVTKLPPPPSNYHSNILYFCAACKSSGGHLKHLEKIGPQRQDIFQVVLHANIKCEFKGILPKYEAD